MRKRPSGPSTSVSARSASTIGSVCGGRPSRRAAYAASSLSQPSSSRVSSAASIASSTGIAIAGSSSTARPTRSGARAISRVASRPP